MIVSLLRFGYDFSYLCLCKVTILTNISQSCSVIQICTILTCFHILPAYINILNI